MAGCYFGPASVYVVYGKHVVYILKHNREEKYMFVLKLPKLWEKVIDNIGGTGKNL